MMSESVHQLILCQQNCGQDIECSSICVSLEKLIQYTTYFNYNPFDVGHELLFRRNVESGANVFEKFVDALGASGSKLHTNPIVVYDSSQKPVSIATFFLFFLMCDFSDQIFFLIALYCILRPRDTLL